jgi:hypothetical protein
MDAYTIYFIVAVVSSFISMIFPYYLKIRQDKTIVFDWSYVWSVFISAIAAGYVLIPEGEVTLKGIILVFCAAMGVTMGTNKINSTRK